MEDFQTICLALIQGITEFLPISSSAHLILPFEVLGWPDQGLAFDVAVHLGSLFAVLAYFRADIVNLLQAFFELVKGNSNEDGRFAISLLIASLPIIPVALLLKSAIESDLRGVSVIMVTTIGFGLLLWLADARAHHLKQDVELTWRDAFVIGLAQCLALVPGTSRSGITMTAALMLGYTRDAASRISFLISIPTIAGAACLMSVELVTTETAIDWRALGLGLLVSGITAYACIHLFLAFINRIGFMPFVVYRLLLGAVLAYIVFA